MMSYRDMTFCTAEECKDFATCFRALNDNVKMNATRWWGNERAPIAVFHDPTKLRCYNPDENKHKTSDS